MKTLFAVMCLVILTSGSVQVTKANLSRQPRADASVQTSYYAKVTELNKFGAETGHHTFSGSNVFHHRSLSGTGADFAEKCKSLFDGFLQTIYNAFAGTERSTIDLDLKTRIINDRDNLTSGRGPPYDRHFDAPQQMNFRPPYPPMDGPMFPPQPPFPHRRHGPFGDQYPPQRMPHNKQEDNAGRGGEDAD